MAVSWPTILYGGSLWLPSGMTAWYRADLIPNLVSTQPVATWPDQSGNGYNATQATQSDQPLFYGNVQNYLPGVLFNGSSDYMATATFTLNPPCTIFAVGLNTDNTTRLFVDGYSASSAEIISLNSTTFQVRGSINLTVASMANLAVLCGVMNGASSLASYNGSTAAGTVSASTPAGLTLGSIGGGGGFVLNGPLLEVIAFNSALSTAARQHVEGYLAWRYNLQALLAGGHPYQTVPPTAGNPWVALNFVKPPKNVAAYDGDPVAYHGRSNYGTHWSTISRVDHFTSFDMPFVVGGADAQAWQQFLDYAATGNAFWFVPNSVAAPQAPFFYDKGRKKLAWRSLGMYKLDTYEMTQVIT
jgi:hypothetical protein